MVMVTPSWRSWSCRRNTPRSVRKSERGLEVAFPETNSLVWVPNANQTATTVVAVEVEVVMN